MSDETVEVPAGRARHPHALGQPAARPARRAAAAAATRAPSEPAGPDDLTPIFPMGLIDAGGLAASREVAIPDAGPRRLPAVAPDAAVPRAPPRAGARHPRAHLLQVRGRLARRLAQAQHRGRRRPTRTRRPASSKLATETGAGQWGSALAFACSLFGLECEVFMVGSSYDQKPYRRSMMQTWGATVHRSPSDLTQSGRAQAAHPTGSLGHRDLRGGRGRRAGRRTRNYSLGSVLNHVLLHQTVIGQEAIAQMELAGDEPDVIVGCVGGGSNFAGLALPVPAPRAARRRADALRRRRAGGLPDADPRRLPLRLRRHRRADAADADVHARPRLRAAARARRRAALPRRRADALRARQGRAWSRRAPTSRTRRSRRRCSSRAPRGSSRRPSRRTRSAR